jgi:glyoxylase-like metal-dependent hydrolase (beta-lactamase superfamily II)
MSSRSTARAKKSHRPKCKEKNVPKIHTIRLAMPFRLGSVNCYLIQTDRGHILIDTGSSNRRADLENELLAQVGNLQLVIVTHGDFDHTGNGAFLRQKHGAKITMHHDDSDMAEHGNMFLNRKSGNFLTKMMAPLIPILFGFGKSQRFKPDLYVEDGSDLSEYGFDAQVLHLPGHSQGSIGILTNDGDLFCGDLFENTKKPALNSIMDDLAAAQASFEKLQSFEINTVYPGHGKPFPMEARHDF